MKRYAATVLLTALVTSIGINAKDRFYLEGMLSDSDLLNVLTDDQSKVLIDSGVFRVYAKYSDGSEAYILDGKQPPYVFVHAGLWDKEHETVHGSSAGKSSFLKGEILEGSGLGFHTINGKLYAYSSGEVRDNPERFIPLLNDVIEQVVDLAANMDDLSKT